MAACSDISIQKALGRIKKTPTYSIAACKIAEHLELTSRSSKHSTRLLRMTCASDLVIDRSRIGRDFVNVHLHEKMYISM